MRDRYIFLSLVIVLSAMLVGVIIKHHIQTQTEYPQDDSASEIEYLQADPGSENYQQLPEDCPTIYQDMPQYYFYTAPPYYVPGVSIWLGGGFWYTPGCNFVFNYTYYTPFIRPIPVCPGFHREPIHIHEYHAQTIIQKQPHFQPQPQPRQQPHFQPQPQPRQQPHFQPHFQPQPQPRHEQPQPRHEQPQPQPRHEQPQPQPRHEPHFQPQPQPRHEQPQPQPRHEQPQPQPRHEQPQPHLQPHLQPQPPQFHPPHKR